MCPSPTPRFSVCRRGAHKFEKWTAGGGRLRARRVLGKLDRMSMYGQFCPVAQALEVVGERWTLLIVRELLCGNYRFSEILHGVPLMSRSLLSQRLKALEEAGLVERRSAPPATAHRKYRLTAAGRGARADRVRPGQLGPALGAPQAERQDSIPCCSCGTCAATSTRDACPRAPRS